MTTSQEVSSSKHKIDSLTSDFFRAISFFEGNKKVSFHSTIWPLVVRQKGQVYA
jgi:hypothetical protein